MRVHAKHTTDFQAHPDATDLDQASMPGHFWSPSKRLTAQSFCVIAVLATLLLLGALAIASANTAFFERYYASLYIANVIITLLFMMIITGLIGIIVVRLFQRKFGARLLAKLAIFFAIVGVLPGSILYLVSLQFVSRSIESWFDGPVETALASGLRLGQGLLDNTLADMRHKANMMANQLAAKHTSKKPLSLTLSHIREQFGLYSATVFSTSGQIQAQALETSIPVTQILPALNREPASPTAFMLRQARKQGVYAAIESETQTDMLGTGLQSHTKELSSDISAAGTLWVRIIAVIPSGYEASLESHTAFLQILQPIAPELARHAQDVQRGYRNYQEKSLSRQGLRKMYIGTLTLALFLATFIAMLLAVILGNQLARPLFLLALGTQEVIRGDYTPKQALKTNDELGFLTQAFSAMTRQLSEARAAVEQNRIALEDSHAYLENILQNLTAGVLVFDHQFHLTTANPGAERIFRRDFQSALSMPFQNITGLGNFSAIVRQAFASSKKQQRQKAHNVHTVDASSAQAFPLPPSHWQQQCEVIPSPEDTPLTLLVRGTHLTRWPDKHSEQAHASPTADAGYVVVFDDISDLISAQRSLAWGEVARRLAHEIKNPLTPIRLSIEQLERKLAPKLDPKDTQALQRATHIILNQVDAMKQMVDDFRDYARTPPAVLQAVQLNDLITEVTTLYASEAHTQAIHLDLLPLPAIYGDPAQLRQVIHNLLQNALDAVAGQVDPHIWVRTQVIAPNSVPKDANSPQNTVARHTTITASTLLASLEPLESAARSYSMSSTTSQTTAQPCIRLLIEDNGPGFSAALLKRALEPYVTTKAKGTGLGLAVVKKIIDEHGALIDLQNCMETSPSLTDSVHTTTAKAEVSKSTATRSTQNTQGAQVSILFMQLAPSSPTQVQVS